MMNGHDSILTPFDLVFELNYNLHQLQTVGDDRMTTITLEVPDELANRLKKFESTTLIEILKKLLDILELSSSIIPSNKSPEETLADLSHQYRTRLEQQGKLNDSVEQILSELADIRDKVATHDYGRNETR